MRTVPPGGAAVGWARTPAAPGPGVLSTVAVRSTRDLRGPRSLTRKSPPPGLALPPVTAVPAVGRDPFDTVGA